MTIVFDYAGTYYADEDLEEQFSHLAMLLCFICCENRVDEPKLKIGRQYRVIIEELDETRLEERV